MIREGGEGNLIITPTKSFALSNCLLRNYHRSTSNIEFSTFGISFILVTDQETMLKMNCSKIKDFDSVRSVLHAPHLCYVGTLLELEYLGNFKILSMILKNFSIPFVP